LFKDEFSLRALYLSEMVPAEHRFTRDSKKRCTPPHGLTNVVETNKTHYMQSNTTRRTRISTLIYITSMFVFVTSLM